MSEPGSEFAILVRRATMSTRSVLVIGYLLLCAGLVHADDKMDAEARQKRTREVFKEYYTIDYGISLFPMDVPKASVSVELDKLPHLVRHAVRIRPRAVLVDEARLTDARILDVPKSKQHRDGMTTVYVVRQPESEISVYAAYAPDEIDLVSYSWMFHGQEIRMLPGRMCLDLILI